MKSLVYLFAQFARKIGYNFHEEADPRVQEMKKTIQSLGSIEFDIEVESDGSWTAQSKNIVGIITGGSKHDPIRETIKDAIFTYFEIPAQLCNDALVKGSDEALKLHERVYV